MKKTVALLMCLGFLLCTAAPVFSQATPSYPLNSKTVNPIDRLFMQPYDEKLDTAATVAELGMLAAPGAFLLVPGADWLSDGLMYAETALISYGARALVKKCVDRARPYMYYDCVPQKLLADDDWNNSFPSGHTTMCFAAAAFATYMFNTRYPYSEWKVPVLSAAYTLAAGTGVMRMKSGNHFLTDVLAGAALGTATGFIVPWAHDQIRELAGLNSTSAGRLGSTPPMVSSFMTEDSFGVIMKIMVY